MWPGSQVARHRSAKPIYMGANPVLASNFKTIGTKSLSYLKPRWRNGLRTTLKMLRSFDHVGSSPTLGTILR